MLWEVDSDESLEELESAELLDEFYVELGIRDSHDLLELSLVELEALDSAELLELPAKLENSDSDELIEVSRE